MTMHPLVVLPAMSVALILEKNRKQPDTPEIPTVLMNYDSRAADVLADQILKPYAQPERCFVSVDLTETIAKVSAYVVLTVPYMLGLEVQGLKIPGPCVCLLGSKAEVSIQGIMKFMPHYEAQKKFTLGIGYQTGPKPVAGSILYPKTWTVELSSMHGGGLREAVTAAIIACGSAPTAEWN